MDKNLLLVIEILAFVVFVSIVKLIVNKKSLRQYPYKRKQSLLSPSEKAFFKTLQDTVGSQFFIFPQVVLSSLVEVEKGTDQWYGYFNKIKSKSIDFVLCYKTNMSPALAIELNDSSHNFDSRRKRDEFLEELLAQVGFSFLQVKVQDQYDTQYILASIQQIITSTSTIVEN